MNKRKILNGNFSSTYCTNSHIPLYIACIFILTRKKKQPISCVAD